MNYIFATNNKHKIDEVSHILGSAVRLRSLADIGCHDDIPETAATIEGNAVMKAQYVYDHYGCDCFADDTGLEVEALGGAPGVHTARYAEGAGHDAEANTRKLLRVLSGEPNRHARFRTVIALITNEGGTPVLKTFEGIVNGTITTEKRGDKGFGYDPVFIPEGYEETFAELGVETKNRISHRAKAVKQLAQHLLEKRAARGGAWAKEPPLGK